MKGIMRILVLMLIMVAAASAAMATKPMDPDSTIVIRGGDLRIHECGDGICNVLEAKSGKCPEDCSSTGFFDDTENHAPRIDVDYPHGTVSGIIHVSWSITDRDNDDIDVTVEYSTDNGETWEEAEIARNLPLVGEGDFDTEAWEDGEYIFRINATDEHNESTVWTSERVEVDNNPPTLSATMTADPTEGEAPLNVTLTCRAENGEAPYTIIIYAYDEDGRTVRLGGDRFSPRGEAEYLMSHVFEAGNYSAYCRVIDSEHETVRSERENFTATAPEPENHAPVIDSAGPFTISEGQTLEFSINAYDPDGDDITISADNLPEGAEFEEDTFSWTPSYNQSGNYTVTFTASDGSLNSTMNVTITVEDVYVPQCSDGIDNDNDGLIDYPEDPGCESPEDDNETDEIIQPLNVTLTADPVEGEAPLDVRFTCSVEGGEDQFRYVMEADGEEFYERRTIRREVRARERFDAGYYNLTCNVTDEEGAEGSDSLMIRSVPEDSTPPNVTLVSPENGSVIYSSNVTAQYIATDNAGGELNCSLYAMSENLEWQAVANQMTQNNTLASFNFEDVPDAEYTWNMMCEDEAGNSAYAPENYTAIIDAVPDDYEAPVVELISPYNGAVLSENNISLVFSASDNLAEELGCTLYGNADWAEEWTELESMTVENSTQASFNFTNVPDGQYNWNVECSDSAGNSAYAAENFTFEVNTSQPALPQCSDGIDNDNDGLIDYPEDPGCESPEDDNETDEAVNQAPVFDPVDDITVNETEMVWFDVNATDPEGDNVDLTAENLPEGAYFYDMDMIAETVELFDGMLTEEDLEGMYGVFLWIPQYGQAGNYTVTFTASDGSLNSTMNVSIEVLEVPEDERLNVTLEAEPEEGESPLNVSFTCSVENGEAPYSYALNVRDGRGNERLQTHGFDSSGSHTFNMTLEEGNWTAFCRIGDNSGAYVDSNEVNVTVTEAAEEENTAPVIELDYPENPLSGAIQLNWSITDNEGDNFDWTAEFSLDSMSTWEVAETSMLDSSGSYMLNTTEIEDGEYWVRLNATDEHGAEASELYLLNISNSGDSDEGDDGSDDEDSDESGDEDDGDDDDDSGDDGDDSSDSGSDDDDDDSGGHSSGGYVYTADTGDDDDGKTSGELEEGDEGDDNETAVLTYDGGNTGMEAISGKMTVDAGEAEEEVFSVSKAVGVMLWIIAILLGMAIAYEWLQKRAAEDSAEEQELYSGAYDYV